MRLGKITTRTGDDGSTGLADGSRIPKDHPRIAAIGSVDELNSHLGVLLAEALPEDIRQELLQVQNELFDLGGCLATPGAPFAPAKLARLDEAIARNNSSLPPLREFVLPGGSRAGALCHVARTIARRAERDYFHLLQSEAVPTDGLRYLNRLSDLMFVLSRVINRQAGCPETLWEQPPK
ncbi:MAG TPA: cob(I)yrinic acid a,c-diamide adenosyltransferase [Sideroxyarcus sp.]|nr:cob(I)yrinic acid a,c-diamide adenosyltransferase [Sideroxyarcus sp.]